jgi:hypothetical protein
MGLRHRRLADGLIDGREGVAMGIKDLIQGFGEVLQQVKAISDLDRVGAPCRAPSA